jgi:hypothetical protein
VTRAVTIMERGSAAIATSSAAAIVLHAHVRNKTLYMDGAVVSAIAVSGYAPSVLQAIILVSISGIQETDALNPVLART